MKKKKSQENEEVNHRPRGHICKGYTWFFFLKVIKIYEELQNSVIKNKQHNLKVDQKPKHWPCQREYMVDKHMKRCSMSHVQKEIQTETKMRHHYIPIRMAKTRNTDNTKYWQGYGGKELLFIVGGNAKW